MKVNGQCWELVFEDSLLRTPADIHFIDENHGWVVGWNALFVKTSDGGNTWENVPHPLHYLPTNSHRALFHVYFLDTLTGWAIQDERNIFRTEDGGQSWEEIIINTPDAFAWSVPGLQFINSDTGWIATHERGFYQTVDGGDTWQYNTELGLIHEILAMQFISGEKGWLLGRPNDPNAASTMVKYLLHTADGGQTWQEQLNANASRQLGRWMFFLNDSLGWLVGYSSGLPALYMTTDGGQSWDSTLNFPANSIRWVQFVDDSTGWLSIPSASNPGMLYSSDGGLGWQQQQINFPPFDYMGKLAMLNDTIGFGLSTVTAKVYRYRARPPACGPALLLPADSSLGRLPELRWSRAEGCFEGYYLQVGATPGGQEVLPRTDVGLDTFYQTTQPLPAGAQLYVTVTPYNYSHGAAQGCPSQAVTTIACPAVTTVVDTGFCKGGALAWGDSLYTTAGTRELLYYTAQGCDSLLVLHLTQYEDATTAIDTAACPGQPLLWQDSLLATPGEYRFEYFTSQGCDSTVAVNFSHWPAYARQVDTFFCQGEAFYWGDSLLSGPGQYIFHYLTVQGCDSTVQLLLAEQADIYVDTAVTLQPGQPYQGAVYEADTLLLHYYPAANGCDSIVRVQLDILSNTAEAWQQAWRCYPNPARGVLWLEGPAPLLRAVLFNLNGAALATYPLAERAEYQAGDGGYRYALRLPALPPGIYLLRLEGEGRVWLEKLVIW
ncbi:MAG: hypothetical protein H6559_01295 [Lewinellaceae bacterium]|nr:hypothetical protein [Lewinellaceae bacterium]